MENKKVKIKVTYTIPEKVNTKLDALIIKAMEHINGEWYAQGVETETGIRDINFDVKL